ncbi:MAG: translocase FtsK, partial [Clostridiales bacterium]|nr:translocase FtsK [Clostridiales bacterium]
MTKKKKSKNSTSGKNVKSEVYGIIIIGLSLLIGISIYVKPSGIAGNMFRDFFYGIFGIGAYVFPILFLLIGFALIVNRGKIKIRMKFWAICVFVYDVLLLLQVNYTYINRELDFMKRLNKAYLLGLESRGGGIFSEIINIPLLYILGRTGTYIILVCIAIILLIVSTEVSLGETFERIIQKYKASKLKDKNKDNNKEIIKINQKNIIEESQDKIDFENNIEKIDKKIKILDFLKRDENKEEDTDKDKEEEEVSDQVKNKASEHKRDYVNTNAPNEIVEEINKNQSEVKKIEYKYPSIDLLAENKFKSNVQDKK